MRSEGIFAKLVRSRPTEAPTGEAARAPVVSRRWSRRQLDRPVACLGIAVVALAPLLPALPYRSTPSDVPLLFTAANSPLKSGTVVLSYPLPITYGYAGPNDQALLWQSVARMRFKLIAFRGAVAGPTGRPIQGAAMLLPPFEAEQVLVWGLYGKPSSPPAMDASTAKAIQIFLKTYGVGAVTVVPWGLRTNAVLAYYVAALQVPPVKFGGSYIWPDVQQDLRRLGLGAD